MTYHPVSTFVFVCFFSKTGDCKGRCVLEGKIMSILVLDVVMGFTFDVFEVPGYCVCKNIT